MKKRLLWAALFTLIGFPLIGWGLLYFFREAPLAVIFRSSAPLWQQILVGLLSGFLLGRLAQALVSLPFLKETQQKYGILVRRLNLNHLEIIFISICAGFGEELLFRGAIQPLVGVWITAIIFVAIHGYLSPTNWRISIYGIFMTLAIALLGLFTDWLGIYTACLAHAMIDYVLFRFLVGTRDDERNVLVLENP